MKRYLPSPFASESRQGPGIFCRWRLGRALGSAVLGGVLPAFGSRVATVVAVAGARASKLMNSAVIDAIVAMPTSAENSATRVGDSSRGAGGVNGAEGA